MKITVVSVVLNAANNIEKTITSVINQTYNNIEYIVIDGKSTDGTIDILKKYETKISKLLIEKDNGLYHAMNKALDIATGDFLIFLNSGDTLLSPDVIEGVAQSINNRNAVYYGDVVMLNADKKKAFFFGGRFGKHRLCFKNICHQSIFYPKNVYRTHLYDLNYRIFADYMYNITLKAEHVKFIYLNSLISFFELGGLSHAGDALLTKNKGRIILQKFGLYYYLYYLLKKNIRIRVFINFLKNIIRHDKKG